MRAWLGTLEKPSTSRDHSTLGGCITAAARRFLFPLRGLVLDEDQYLTAVVYDFDQTPFKDTSLGHLQVGSGSAKRPTSI